MVLDGGIGHRAERHQRAVLRGDVKIAEGAGIALIAAAAAPASPDTGPRSQDLRDLLAAKGIAQRILDLRAD